MHPLRGTRAGRPRCRSTRTSKWTCGPVELPVLPEYETTSPAATDCPTDDGEGRVVGVRGREAVSVVDDDEVPVAAHPAGVDHRPGGSGADGRSQRHGDVDALVHAPPARAEPARDRARDRPAEQAAARGRDDRGCRRSCCWACADPRGERRALLLERLDLLRASTSRSSLIEASVADFSLCAATSASRLATSRVTTPRCSAVAESTAASTRAACARASAGAPASVRHAVTSTP